MSPSCIVVRSALLTALIALVAGDLVYGGGSSGVAIPGWVPVYPGVKSEIDSGYPKSRTEMRFILTTNDGCRPVVAFYQKELTLAGFKIVESGRDQEGCTQVMDSHNPLGSRAVNLTIGRTSYGTGILHTQIGMEVVQRDEAMQSTEGDARIPAWVPVYPRWNPRNFSVRRGGSEDFLSFSFTTGDSAQALLSWYQDRLRQAGFRADMDVFGTNGVLHSNTRDNGRYLKIEVARTGGVNVVSMEIRDRRK